MDETYYFHQTPKDLAKDLINLTPLIVGDTVLEPFAGENAFYDSIPPMCQKIWSEITRGRDYKDVKDDYDWVITNPPFRLETGTKRVNSFWFLLDYYSTRAKKGVAFLANDGCFCTLTTRRIEILKNRGWTMTKIVVCSIKKWRGRYFYIIFEKKHTDVVSCLLKNY